MEEVSLYSRDGGQFGCGLMGAIFGRRSFHMRKTSAHSLLTARGDNMINNSKKPPVHNSKKQRTKDCTASLDSNLPKSSPKVDRKLSGRHSLFSPNHPVSGQKNEGRRASNSARRSASSSGSSVQTNLSQPKEAKPRRAPNSDSRELVPVATTNDKKCSDGKSLFRATSSNVLPLGHLGNLSQQGNGNVGSVHGNPQEVKSTPRASNDRRIIGGNGVMGNILRQPSVKSRQSQGLMTTMDPEVLKSFGNEKYKQGNFKEALAFYDRSIALDPSKATYRCNRSAALIGLGHLVDAVFESEEAIRIDPSYERAHRRLATLYVRLGEAEKALYHYKLSGSIVNHEDIAQAQALQKHLKGCIEALKLKEWVILLKETESAISSGADSAPQVYTMQAEALLRLNRHREAYTAYQKGSNFTIYSLAKLFGLADSAQFLTTGAEIYMAAGRFEDAIVAAQLAAGLNPSNQEVSTLVKKVRALAFARSNGNLLYRTSKFAEACVAYSQGLERDPHNSVLLCNRAACRSKLGQFEQAVEDCTAALRVRPYYVKARLRRADCNAKLQRWEASIQDYEELIRGKSADEEVGRALLEAQVQLKKQRGESTKDLQFGSNLAFISSNERFRHLVTSPGMSVVLFCKRDNNKQALQHMEQICTKFPSVNFLKVEIEDQTCLAKSEGVTSLPSFKIYKNGSQVIEIPGHDRELLEKLVRLHSS
uniref:Uncharacterized protein MANES_02G153700 n=1 Tax=Rhizophora mucronata TaxID=61149 RepID=A0A2P2IMP2_RHIMU